MRAAGAAGVARRLLEETAAQDFGARRRGQRGERKVANAGALLVLPAVARRAPRDVLAPFGQAGQVERGEISRGKKIGPDT